MKCAVENNVGQDDLKRLAKKEIPSNQNAKCLLSCAFKDTGMVSIFFGIFGSHCLTMIATILLITNRTRGLV